MVEALSKASITNKSSKSDGAAAKNKQTQILELDLKHFYKQTLDKNDQRNLDVWFCSIDIVVTVLALISMY